MLFELEVLQKGVEPTLQSYKDYKLCVLPKELWYLNCTLAVGMVLLVPNLHAKVSSSLPVALRMLL